ncbi:MAG: CBS domain-containing protein [Nitrososphaerales archaeon]
MQQYLQLKAKDVSNKAIKLEPDKTLYDARNAMLRYNISRVVIAKDSKPVGIITEKDIARFLYRHVARRRLNEIRLDEVMSTNLITVDEQSDLNICAKLMIDKEISSLIVVDSKGDLKGIFTKSDLMSVYAINYAGRNLVEDYMTKPVFTVEPDETTHMVLLIMVNNKVSRVVVVRNQKPVGIITGRDLLPMSALFGPDTYEIMREVFVRHREEQIMVPSGISALFLARDVMRHDPITITNDSDLAEAAQIMARNRISGLPVVDSNSNLVGIVTKTDVVRALAVMVKVIEP